MGALALASLKRMFQAEDDPERVMTDFIDLLGEHPRFFMGRPARVPELEAVLTLIGQAVLKRRAARIDHLLLVRIEGHDFVHGVFTVDDCMANVIFFEDLGGGVLGLLEGKTTHLVRFLGGAVELEEGREAARPSAN